jgi:hypothetical protein
MVSSDMFTGVIYQMVVISPAMSWILQPGRFSPRKGFLYAVGFLMLMAAITIALQVSENPSNFYSVVGVPRDSSLSEIKKAFRLRSIDLHPDKNPSPTAVAEFSRLRLAFDVLGDADKRILYDLYGEGAIEKERQVLLVETLINALSYYGVWSVLTFVLTLNANARDARAWTYAGIVVLFIAEINLQFAGASLPPKFFPFLTIFEFVQLLRAAFPLFVNGARSIGGYYYRDVVTENFMLGIELLKSNKVTRTCRMRTMAGRVELTRVVFVGDLAVHARTAGRSRFVAPTLGAASGCESHDRRDDPIGRAKTSQGEQGQCERGCRQTADASAASRRVGIVDNRRTRAPCTEAEGAATTQVPNPQLRVLHCDVLCTQLLFWIEDALISH